jgi:aerobic-type carbon monoxide dehydrogenase small subunit (CoxS/CutS family)
MQNCDLKTVEGLAKNKHLSSLQEAFLKHFSFQCGFSTPGFLMGAYILLSELENKPIHKNQIEEAILRVVGEHICRCTGYAKYHEAIREVILNTPGLLIADK